MSNLVRTLPSGRAKELVMAEQYQFHQPPRTVWLTFEAARLAEHQGNRADAITRYAFVAER